VWQGAFIRSAGYPDNTYVLSFPAASGFIAPFASKFFYFLYYTGRFPISTTQPEPELPDSREAAAKLLENNPRLIMEDNVFIRSGELAKILLLYPDAWTNGTPRGATLETSNRVLWVGSLLALFVSLSLLEHRLLAVALVALIGSNPFQLGQIYAENNILGYSMPVAALMLALNAPLILARRPNRLAYALPLLSGAALASVREIRTEPALVILAVALACLCTRGGWRRRSILLATLVAAWSLTSALWKLHWDHEFAEAHAIVSAAGGTTFDGYRNLHHSVWHPIWCGLGDFDTRYGYRWWDGAAHDYAIPILDRRFGIRYRKIPGTWLFESSDTSDQKLQTSLETVPEYSLVLREKVLRDIRNDPGWYASILARRLHTIFTVITPVRLGLGTRYVDIPFSAWLLLPALLLLVAAGRADQVLLLLFFLSTSLPSLLVFSGLGFTYNSAFHLALFALVICWLTNAASRMLAPIGRAGTPARPGRASSRR
jgi:hypothetical protein